MGFLVNSNTYFVEHKGLFAAFLYSVLAIMLALFIGALIHVRNGTNYSFVIFLAASVVVDILCYSVYSYYVLKDGEAKGSGACWFFLALSNFQVYHWALSFTYFTCSQELPYVSNQEKVPKRTRLLNRIFYWTVMVIGGVAAIWPFFLKS